MFWAKWSIFLPIFYTLKNQRKPKFEWKTKLKARTYIAIIEANLALENVYHQK